LCFLDASRAFDIINFWSLFEKLARRGVPLLVVRLLFIWYNSQEFCVKWRTSTSVYFKTSNGVWQGGILSQRLFSLYIDDFSILLANTQVGCYIDNTCVNLFFMQTTCVYWPRPPSVYWNLLAITILMTMEISVAYMEAQILFYVNSNILRKKWSSIFLKYIFIVLKNGVTTPCGVYPNWE